tara:strand:+ start:1999 stop:2598 length:600 start_codon:yes stop_codon:yes gene_type:complete
MKKILLAISLFATTNVIANEKEDLKNLLANVDGLSAIFSQSVVDQDNNLIMEAEGELVFKQPNQFSWKVKSPEEELLLSNGEELWYYSPFLEQVTIYNTKDKLITTPFALLVSNDEEVWKNFNISKEKNNYIIESKNNVYSNIEKLLVSFKNKVIEKIVVLDSTQQEITYDLSNQKVNKDLSYNFNFIIPDNISIDDNR